MCRGCIPILLLAAGFAQDQQTINSIRPVGGVSIPAELTSTIRAERVHRGDPVEFRSLQAVLISSGVVMPANAKLTGRIVGAAPRHGDKPSWLVLLVERGEWKNQSVPLHAFIAAQISVSQVPLQAQQTDGSSPSPSPRRTGRESARVAAENGVDMSTGTRLPQDSGSGPSIAPIEKTPALKDLRIVRDENGITYLFSQHDNVKLPSGTLFRLQDESSPQSHGAGAKEKPENMFTSQP
jgi:hypothetical protein